MKFSAGHLRKELDQLDRVESDKAAKQAPEPDDPAKSHTPTLPHSNAPFRDLIIAGPAPAPLLRAESYYRYQLMIRTRQMSKLSQSLARLTETIALPDDIALTVDIDPVNLI